MCCLWLLDLFWYKIKYLHRCFCLPSVSMYTFFMCQKYSSLYLQIIVTHWWTVPAMTNLIFMLSHLVATKKKNGGKDKCLVRAKSRLAASKRFLTVRSYIHGVTFFSNLCFERLAVWQRWPDTVKWSWRTSVWCGFQTKICSRIGYGDIGGWFI